MTPQPRKAALTLLGLPKVEIVGDEIAITWEAPEGTIKAELTLDEAMLLSCMITSKVMDLHAAEREQ